MIGEPKLSGYPQEGRGRRLNRLLLRAKDCGRRAFRGRPSFGTWLEQRPYRRPRDEFSEPADLLGPSDEEGARGIEVVTVVGLVW